MLQVSDDQIARKLNITEVNVQSCISWLLRFLNSSRREELVRRGSTLTTSSDVPQIAA